jgi:hypothetical protein
MVGTTFSQPAECQTARIVAARHLTEYKNIYKAGGRPRKKKLGGQQNPGGDRQKTKSKGRKKAVSNLAKSRVEAKTRVHVRIETVPGERG